MGGYPKGTSATPRGFSLIGAIVLARHESVKGMQSIQINSDTLEFSLLTANTCSSVGVVQN